MSENQNRGIGDLSKHDAMTTEELEEILRLDAQAPEEQESDTDKILYIMEVLAERKRKTGYTGKTAHEAYESFKQHYMPETDKPIIPKKTGRTRWVRSLTATAAVLAILLVGSVTAEAFGFNIWRAVIQWTQETFHFGNWGNSDPNSKLSYDSLQEALEQRGITTPLAPTWFPDGYALDNITVEQSPIKKVYTAIYTREEESLKITVRDYLDEDPVYVEQSEGLAEKYEVSGIVYYLFTDVDAMKASWINGSYECSVAGNVTVAELKAMINSIEKG